MYRWWLFLHILGAAGFLLAHGISVGVALGLRRERDPAGIRTLLGLSSKAMGGLYVSLLLLLVSGVVAGFLGSWWGQGWIWTALGLLVALWLAMSVLGTKYFDRVRIAVGEDPVQGSKKQKEALRANPGPAEDLEALLASNRPMVLVWMGGVGLLVILWLMVLKPF